MLTEENKGNKESSLSSRSSVQKICSQICRAVKLHTHSTNTNTNASGKSFKNHTPEQIALIARQINRLPFSHTKTRCPMRLRKNVKTLYPPPHRLLSTTFLNYFLGEPKPDEIATKRRKTKALKPRIHTDKHGFRRQKSQKPQSGKQKAATDSSPRPSARLARRGWNIS